MTRIAMENNRILVTAIGSFSADCVIRILKQNNCYVVGTDIYPNEWHFESMLCDKVYQAPGATDRKAYISFLLKVIVDEDIKGIIPLTDVEIDVINLFRAEFQKLGVVIYTQSERTLSIARDKKYLSSFFDKDSSVKIPKFVDSKALTDDFVLPAIAKPINGRSSEGIVRIYDRDELIKFIGRDNYIIQEFLEGDVCTVDYVRDKYGNDFSVPRVELLRTKNGAGTTVRIFSDKEISKLVSHIGNKIGVIGCVNMEFIKNNEDFFLIDINPRFSAGVAFTNFVGYDMVMNHVKAINGIEIDRGCDFKDQILCKHYSEKLLLTISE